MILMMWMWNEISREMRPENETEAVWWSGVMIVMVVDGWIVMVVMKLKGYLRSMRGSESLFRLDSDLVRFFASAPVPSLASTVLRSGPDPGDST